MTSDCLARFLSHQKYEVPTCYLVALSVSITFCCIALVISGEALFPTS